MNTMKKIVAVTAAAAIMTTSCVSIASAGVLGDLIGSIGSTLGQGLKTAGQAIAGTVVRPFSTETSDSLYEDMKESASKTVKNASTVVDNTVQLGKDTVDAVEGVGMMIGGGAATVVCAIGEGVEYAVTLGESDFSYTKNCGEVFVDGYKKADNDLILDVAMVGGACFGVPTYLVGAVKVAKSGIEYAAGAKSGQEVLGDVIGTTVSAVTMGAGSAIVSSTGSVVAGQLTTAAVSTGAKIAADVITNDSDRSVSDIIMEDVATTGVNMAIGYGMRKAGEAVRGTSANNGYTAEDARADAEYRERIEYEMHGGEYELADDDNLADIYTGLNMRPLY